MRRHWLTILMALTLAGLGAYVYFVDLPTERSKTEAETAEKQILPFTEREISGLTVRTATGEIVLTKNDKWQITSPLQAEADARTVEGMVRALVVGKVTRVVEDQAAALAPFGLDPPAVSLVVSADGRQETLSIGDSGPISSTLYAMRASDKKVLLTDLAAKDFLNKTLFNLRKKDIVPVTAGQVDRVRLTYPKTEIVLYRSDKDKAKPKWVIRYPIEAQADQPEVRTLLLKIEDLKAIGFVDPGPERDELVRRLTKPDVKVTLHAGGNDVMVKLYQPDPNSGEAFAVTNGDGPVYRINPMAIKELTKELFTLQDKRLLGVEGDDIAMLEVKTRTEHYTLIRQNNVWVLEEEPAKALDQEKAAVFVSRVVELPAEIRVVKQAGPLAPYGLASPAAEFTAIGKDGKVAGRLALGSQTGGLVYAIGRGLPGLYQARSDLLTQVPTRHELFAARSEGT
ncbi:DUF4340 domain-containing protein [Candidatus Nitrospira bockiana]